MDTKISLTYDDMRAAVIDFLLEKKKSFELCGEHTEVERLEFYPWFVTFCYTSLKTGLSYIESYIYPDLYRMLIL